MSSGVEGRTRACEGAGEEEMSRFQTHLNVVLMLVVLAALLVACSGVSLGVPKAPSEVSVEPEEGGIRVSWRDNSDDELGFRIYRFDGLEPLSISEAEKEVELSANEESYLDADVTSGSAYSYRVEAFNAFGPSRAVAEGEDPAPPPPSGQARVTIVRSGGGAGRIESDPVGISCDHVTGEGCSATFAYGTVLTLTPAPANDSIFTGWEGACEGADACSFTVMPDLADEGGTVRVTANMRRDEATLSVSKAGSGSGLVRDLNSDGGIINCGDTCRVSYSTVNPVVVVLEAVPDEGFIFAGWSAPCAGQTGDCRVSIDGAIELEARFTAPTPRITSFEGSPAKVKPGQEVSLSWSLSGAATGVRLTATADGDETVVEVPEGATSVTVTPDVSTIYRLVALGEGGESEPAEAAVAIGDAPIITRLEADDDTVTAGTDVALVWDISGQASVVTLKGDGADRRVSGGGATVTPQQTTTYTLIAKNDFGRNERDVTVEVGEAPAIRRFTADPAEVTRGQRTDLEWQVTGANKLEISPAIGEVSGSKTRTDPLTQDTTFRLTATNDFGSSARQATVTVKEKPKPKPKIVNFGVRGDVTEVLVGQEITLEWDIENQDALTELAIEFDDEEDELGNPTTLSSLTTEVKRTTVYRLRAVAPGDDEPFVVRSDPVTVTALEPANIGTFTGPDEVEVGETFDLSWTGVVGETISLSRAGNEIKVNKKEFPNGKRSLTAPDEPGELIFALKAEGPRDSEASETWTVQVVEPSTPTAIDSFKAPDEVEVGEAFTLSWEGVTGETIALTRNGEALTTRPADFPDGEREVTAEEAGEIVFVLTASSPGETPVRRTETVTVLEPDAGLPTILSFEASALSIEAGEEVLITWVIPDQDSLTNLVMLRDPGTNIVAGRPTEQNAFRASPNQTTTYTLRAFNEAGSTESDSLTVSVTGSSETEPGDSPADDTAFFDTL